MKCDDLKTQLSAYEDNELNSEQKKLVEEHLSKCPECQAELTDYKRIRNLMASLQSTPENINIKEIMMIKINSAAKPKRWLRPVLVGVPIGIALVITLSLSLPGMFSDNLNVIARASSEMEKLESYRYTKDDYSQIGETGEQILTYHFELQYTSPDRYHVIISSKNSSEAGFSQSVEFVIGDQVYNNQPVPYVKDREYFEQFTLTKDMTLGVLDTLVAIESLPEEIINGIDCYHHVGEVDINKYLEWTKPSLKQQHARLVKNLPGTTRDFDEYFKRFEDMFRDRQMTHELWIGKDDYLIRQWKITIQDISDSTSGGNIITSYLKYYDLNKEINIEPPLDQSGELLDGWSVYTFEEE